MRREAARGFRNDGVTIRGAVIATLRAHEAKPRRRRGLHDALSGSTARDEGMPERGIDIMIKPKPGASAGLFEYVHISQYPDDLVLKQIDVANRSRGTVRISVCEALSVSSTIG